MAAIFHGRATVAAPGTAVPFATGSEPVPASWIIVTPCKADGSANAGEVRIGGVPAAAAIPAGEGLPIAKTAAPQLIPPQWGYDLRKVYVDSDGAGDGVAFLYGTA